MVRFSERMGIVTLAPVLARDEMPDELRNSLWNAVHVTFFQVDLENNFDSGANEGFRNFARFLWLHHYKIAIDEIPWRSDNVLSIIKSRFFEAAYYKLYDTLEFFADHAEHLCRLVGSGNSDLFTRNCNYAFETERAAYRFVDRLIAPIIDEVEVDEIERAELQTTSDSVSRHIMAAVTLFRNRTDPDFRNSIKESISAVEAAVNFLTGEKSKSLAVPLQTIAKNHNLHGAFVKGLTSLYGFTCDSSGIRHALTETDAHVGEAEARYMLVACSAFANYLISLKSI